MRYEYLHGNCVNWVNLRVWVSRVISFGLKDFLLTYKLKCSESNNYRDQLWKAICKTSDSLYCMNINTRLLCWSFAMQFPVILKLFKTYFDKFFGGISSEYDKIITDLHNCPLIYVHSLVVVRKNLSHFWIFQSAVFKLCLCIIFKRINWKVSEWKGREKDTLWPQLYMPLKMNKFRFFHLLPCHRLLENTSICFVSWRKRRNKQHLVWWSINAYLIFFSWNIRRNLK